MTNLEIKLPSVNNVGKLRAVITCAVCPAKERCNPKIKSGDVSGFLAGSEDCSYSPIGARIKIKVVRKLTE